MGLVLPAPQTALHVELTEREQAARHVPQIMFYLTQVVLHVFRIVSLAEWFQQHFVQQTVQLVPKDLSYQTRDALPALKTATFAQLTVQGQLVLHVLHHLVYLVVFVILAKQTATFVELLS